MIIDYLFVQQRQDHKVLGLSSQSLLFGVSESKRLYLSFCSLFCSHGSGSLARSWKKSIERKRHPKREQRSSRTSTFDTWILTESCAGMLSGRFIVFHHFTYFHLGRFLVLRSIYQNINEHKRTKYQNTRQRSSAETCGLHPSSHPERHRYLTSALTAQLLEALGTKVCGLRGSLTTIGDR